MLPPIDLPGIRPVRLLGATPAVEVHLVRLDDDGDGEAAQLVRPCGAEGVRRVVRMIAGAARVDDPGIVRVHDAVDDVHGIAALREHLPGRRLSEVLAVRSAWAAGEAVAVLAPIVRAVEALHRAGAAHGALGAAAVLLSPRGPVLDDLLEIELFEAGAPEAVRSGVPAAAADREALRALALDMLARVVGARETAARELLARAVSAPGTELIGILERGLAELAAPVAVRDEDPAPFELPARAEPVLARAEEVAEARALLPVPIARLLGPELAARAEEVAAWTGALLRRMPDRTRVLFGGAAAAITTASVLLLVVPGPEAASGDALTSRPALTEGVGDAHARGTDGQGGVTDIDPLDAALPDEPLEALAVLLARREECFRELSLLCLEQVDQSGSAALHIDRTALEAMRAGAAGVRPVAEPSGARIVERLGGSVLVELGPETAPASLLMMRSEAGWRIRDWVAWSPGS